MAKKKDINNYKQYKFTDCESCGSYPALFRWYNNKYECTDCAKRSFSKYLAALVAGAAVIVIGLIIF